MLANPWEVRSVVRGRFRSFRIFEPLPVIGRRCGCQGLVSVRGGKWTNFRLMGEATIEISEWIVGIQPHPSQPLCSLGTSEPEAADVVNTSDPRLTSGTEMQQVNAYS